VGESQTVWQRIGLTRGKAALIGVLAVALVGVMYVQYGGSNDADSAALADESPRPWRMPRAENPEVAASMSDEQWAKTEGESVLAAAFDPSRWRAPELATVVAYDPFALPESFPRPPEAALDPRLVVQDAGGSAASADAAQLAETIEALRMELEALQQRGVQVIVSGRDRYVAMIGDRMVHVGDEINGFTVTAIDSQGVRVERKVDR